MKKIDIVISTKDNNDNLFNCINNLNTIFDDSGFTVRVIVVDNHSLKQTKEKQLIKFVKFNSYKNLEIFPMFLGKTYGKYKCINLGIKYALTRKYNAETIMVLNDSYIVEKEELFKCIENSKTTIMKNDFDKFYLNSIKNTSFVEENTLLNYHIINEVISLINISKNKKVIYTYSNNKLPKIGNLNKSYDYICFTLNENLKSDIWNIINVKKIINYLGIPENHFKVKEFFKLHPHYFFKNEKEISIWVDSLQINFIDMNQLDTISLKDEFLITTNMLEYDCIYRYLASLRISELITKQEFDSIFQLYLWYNIQQHIGIVIDDKILIRKHNNSKCISIMNTVWTFFEKYYIDTKLFFNLVLIHNKYNYSYIPTIFLDKLLFKENC